MLLGLACLTPGLGGGPAAAAVVSSPAGGSPAAGGGSAGAGSWTVYHGDPAGEGVASVVTAVDTKAPVWTSPAVDGQIYGEPLVYAGHVFVATENDTVYALSAATGAVTWFDPSRRSGTRWIAAVRGYRAYRRHHGHARHRPVTE